MPFVVVNRTDNLTSKVDVDPLLLHCRAPEGAGLHISTGEEPFRYPPKLVLTDTLVRGNNATRGGGGLRVNGFIDVAFSNTSFVDNRCVCNLGLEFLSYVYHHALLQQTCRVAFVWQLVTSLLSTSV